MFSSADRHNVRGSRRYRLHIAAAVPLCSSHMDRRRSGARSPQRFRAQKRQVDDLLRPDVLDDETRRMLMADVMNPANRPRGDVSSLKPNPQRQMPQQDVSAGADGNGQSRATASPSPAKGKPDVDGRYPAQLRSRVQSGSEDLVTAMAARLGDLEKRQKHYLSEIEEMQSKYRQLNDAFQKEVNRRNEAERLVVDLYDEKKELEDELAEMKHFLTDCGLSWHGPTTPRRKKSEKNAGGAETGSRSPSPAQSEAGKFDLYAGDFQTPGHDAALQTDASSPPLSRHNSGPVHFTNTAKKGTHLFSPPSPEKAKATKTKPPAAIGEDGTVDVALLIKNARILSDYVGWKAIVKVGDRGAAIRDRNVVRVVVYKNGICVNNGAFRPYGWALCDAFLNDLAEGYYPYEFKDKYPDGFPIEVTDRSTETLDVRGQSPQRGGAGHRLGGAAAGGGGAPSLQQLREGGYQPVSAEEFLKKVPAQAVTAEGKLVKVRDGVAQLMGKGPKDDEKLRAASGVPLGTVRHVTAAEAQYREEASRANSAQDAAAQTQAVAGQAQSPMVLGDLVALLIRLPDGKKVTLNMPRDSTIYDVRKELGTAAPEFARESYELCQAFPAKTFSDHHITLAELGITRTCTLMVRVNK